MMFEKKTPPVGSAALCARVAELEDAGELDSPGSDGSCRFDPVSGTPSLQKEIIRVSDLS
jgi:hypothetical protein